MHLSKRDITFLDENNLTVKQRSIERAVDNAEKVRTLMGNLWHHKMLDFVGNVVAIWYFNEDMIPVVVFQKYLQVAVPTTALTLVTSGITNSFVHSFIHSLISNIAP